MVDIQDRISKGQAVNLAVLIAIANKDTSQSNIKRIAEEIILPIIKEMQDDNIKGETKLVL